MSYPNTKNLFSLSGKKAIVTGASGGIGIACAKALALHGARLILLGRKMPKLQKARLEIIDFLSEKPEIELFCINFEDLKQLKAFFAEHGDIDILLNSIGFNEPRSLFDVDEENYDNIIDTNTKLAFFQTKYFAEFRRKHIEAKQPVNDDDADNNYAMDTSIIHISSQMGLVGGFDRSVYCGAKHALEGFTKALALELGKWAIRINTICPTFIPTDMTKSTLEDPKKLLKVRNHMALNRLGHVDDIMGAAVYLASSASSLVTGSALKVDAAWTAH